MTKADSITRTVKIKCTNCGYEIPAEETLAKKIEEKIKTNYEQDLKQKIQELDKKRVEEEEFLAKELLRIQKEAEELPNIKLEELASENKRLIEENKVLKNSEEELRKRETQITERYEKKLREITEELPNKKLEDLVSENKKLVEENRILKSSEAESKKREIQISERSDRTEIELQKRLLEEKDKIEEEIKKKESGKYDLLIKEYEKTIEELNIKIEKEKEKDKEKEMKISEVNTKKDSMTKYLTSKSFAEKIDSAISEFDAMKELLNKEKNMIQSIWAQRASRIEKASEDIIEVYGSIKGIGGDDIPDISSLKHSEKD